MKKITFIVGLVLVALAIAGCATTGTQGVVQTGPDQYMIGGLGKFTDFSGSAVKARFYHEASQFCAAKGMGMEPVSSSGQDSGLGTYSSAEVHFRCVAKSQSRAINK